jgi:ABC-type nitrate/sulfonate/bicarbonate transport system substrate-binding protein
MISTKMTRAQASALLAGGAFWSLAPARAQSAGKLRVAAAPVEGAANVYYAKDMGFLAKAGLDVDIQSIPSSNAIAAAVLSNAIDIGYITLDVLAALHSKNFPAVVIAPGAEYRSPATERIAALMVPANSIIRQAKDLDGKVVGVPGLHSFGQTVASAWIDQNGGNSSSVKFVEVPFPATPAALSAGRVDAAMVAEPFLGVAKKNGGGVLFYGYDVIAKRFLLGTWSSSSQWAKNNPDLASRFATAMHEAAVWANENPEPSGAILTKYMKIDPATIGTMARYRFAETITPALMQPLIDVSAKYNDFSSFPASELLYAPSR